MWAALAIAAAFPLSTFVVWYLERVGK